MAMEIITGYTGIEHVKSADDAAIYRGVFGSEDYVLDVGNKFGATIIDNNTIKVADGDLVIQGHQARIRANDYEELTINNGIIGEKRNDLIVAKYEKDTNTGVESVDLIVKEGQSGSTAQDPTVELGDITEGAISREFPLYRVKLDGLNIIDVEKLFETSKTLKVFNEHLADYATGCRVHHSLDQSVASGVAGQILSFNTTEYDSNNMHSNEKIYIPTSGKYLLNLTVRWEPNATGRRQLYLLKNATKIASGAIGVNTVQPVTQSARGTEQNFSIVYYLEKDDYVSVVVLQESGVALKIQASSTGGVNLSPVFTVERVG